VDVGLLSRALIDEMHHSLKSTISENFRALSLDCYRLAQFRGLLYPTRNFANLLLSKKNRHFIHQNHRLNSPELSA
jgi:hypothetical protein